MSATATSAVCQEKARLFREYEQAREKYYEAATQELEGKRSTSQTPDYERLVEGVEAARRFMGFCRRALLRHIAQHGC
jgi:hypothetical protein